jgi:ribosomal protein S18 acetylase RimI-like enzyme
MARNGSYGILGVWYMNEAAIRLYKEWGFKERLKILQADL